jgi:periplasmic protein TonB
MAVQIINDMPDFEVHRGEPIAASLHELNTPREESPRFSGRAVCIAITIAIHVLGALAFMQMTYQKHSAMQPPPIMATLIEEARPVDTPPPDFAPPPMDVSYSLPTPDPVVVDTEIVATNAITTTPMSDAPVSTTSPPMVESVEYVRAAPPVYPRESQRRHEHGTVVLRVLVDAEGRPAQIQVERSSGFERLDNAARDAVAKFLFRPYEVNGIKQSAQVLIPIGFDRRAS